MKQGVRIPDSFVLLGNKTVCGFHPARGLVISTPSKTLSVRAVRRFSSRNSHTVGLKWKLSHVREFAVVE